MAGIFVIDRFTRMQDDPITANIRAVLDDAPSVAYAMEIDYEQETGFPHQLHLRRGVTWAVSTDGIDSIADEMAWLGEAAGETADEMLLAGAEEVKRAWQETAEAHGYHDSGDMIESIKADKAPKSDADGVRKIDVYPRGQDHKKKPVRNAEKAYLLHYGTSRIRGSHWIEEAEQKALPTVQQVFEDIWDRHLKGG